MVPYPLRAIGMRPSEALGLVDTDIDDTKGIILIRNSKCKSRLVPVSASVLEAVARYRDARDSLRPHRKPPNLIISTGRIALTLCSADDMFLEYRMTRNKKTVAGFLCRMQPYFIQQGMYGAEKSLRR